MRRMTRNEFINKAIRKHGTHYSYSRVMYKDSTKKVIIICPKHGEFLQTPHNHLYGNGCPHCKNRNLALSVEEFIERANAIHNGKYSYDLVHYTNARTKVTITCPVHGPFEQLPMNHLKGSGCRKCSSRSFNLRKKQSK